MSDKELNSVIDRAEDEYQKLKDKVIEQGLEIERLNNIINEFDKWLEEQENNSTYPSMIFIGSARYKLQELKGSDKE